MQELIKTYSPGGQDIPPIISGEWGYSTCVNAVSAGTRNGGQYRLKREQERVCSAYMNAIVGLCKPWCRQRQERSSRRSRWSRGRGGLNLIIKTIERKPAEKSICDKDGWTEGSREADGQTQLRHSPILLIVLCCLSSSKHCSQVMPCGATEAPHPASTQSSHRPSSSLGSGKRREKGWSRDTIETMDAINMIHKIGKIGKIDMIDMIDMIDTIHIVNKEARHNREVKREQRPRQDEE